jgi:hypothetical protein
MSIVTVGIDWRLIGVTYLAGVAGCAAGMKVGARTTVPRGFRARFTALVFLLSVALLVLAAGFLYVQPLGFLCAAVYGAMLGFLGSCAEPTVPATPGDPEAHGHQRYE